MEFFAIIYAISVTIAYFILYFRKCKSKIGLEEVKSTSVSWSVMSPVDAEDMFFNDNNRIQLFWSVVDGIPSFYLDRDFTQKALDGYYCDGFFIININENAIEIKELI